jgi:hypothetical protein
MARYPELEIVRLADVDVERAKKAAVEYDLPAWGDDAELYAAGREVLATAAASGRVLGSAPDTFLGSASQTARRALDDGLIGEPVGAAMFVGHSKAERWHPDPRFLFRAGGGPVLDMGPYYVASEGTGAACLGEPLNSLAWLAATVRDLGEPLRAGQVVLSGALGPMVAVSSGARVRTEITGLGAAEVVFS